MNLKSKDSLRPLFTSPDFPSLSQKLSRPPKARKRVTKKELEVQVSQLQTELTHQNRQACWYRLAIVLLLSTATILSWPWLDKLEKQSETASTRSSITEPQRLETVDCLADGQTVGVMAFDIDMFSNPNISYLRSSAVIRSHGKSVGPARITRVTKLDGKYYLVDGLSRRPVMLVDKLPSEHFSPNISS